MTYKEEFITFMVRSGVLTFGDFTTKSGRKTPYFINTGNYKTGAQAAKLGISLEGATLYCTHQPCVICCKIIINAGIKRVVYQYGYPDEFSLELFKEANIEIVQISEEELNEQ